MFKPKLIYVAVVATLLVAACGEEKTSATATVLPATPASLELAKTDVATVVERVLQKSVVVTGQLQALNYTTVQSEVNASVAQVLVREGEAVQKGQIIVKLATQDLQARAKQAEAALASAKAESVLANAVKERNEQLYKDKYISDIDYKKGIAEAQARSENVKAQESLLAIAKKALNDAVIVAPMSGIVAKRYVQAGQMVAMNNPVLDVVDLSQLELVATIAPEHLAALQVGQSLQFNVQGFSESFSAKVSRINPVADAATRAVTFYGTVQNPQAQLKAGLFVQGTLALGSATQGLVIPKVSLRHEQNQSYVWIVEANKLSKRSIDIGLIDDKTGQVLIRQGLQAGDKVVLAQLNAQAVNMPIKLVE
ncbi:MAG: efflux RND transporter periplasmic adaptor subunit [Pseudomonadales bacterium]|nr:efflux RND transporter periplasmic adaptor subunit [Pseudomonadales bacterium]